MKDDEFLKESVLAVLYKHINNSKDNIVLPLQK